MKTYFKTYSTNRHHKFWTNINLIKSFKLSKRIKLNKKVLQTFKPLNREMTQLT